MSTLASVVEYGLASAMSAASIPGRIYYTSDTFQIFRDNGISWDNVTPSTNAATIEAIQQEEYIYAPDTGAANALVVSQTPAPTIVAGSIIVVKAAATNTGATTIAVNGTPSVSVTKRGATALSGGEISIGQIISLIYDGTQYQLLSSGGSGGVTSVAMSVPSRQTITGSPITGSGTLAISDNTQTDNVVFAGPASGAAAAPTFRALVAGDLPTLYTEDVSFTGTSGTLSHTPVALIGLFRNGIIMSITSGASAIQKYSISGASITLTTAAGLGDWFYATYF